MGLGIGTRVQEGSRGVGGREGGKEGMVDDTET